jgi:hypothetical protein
MLPQPSPLFDHAAPKWKHAEPLATAHHYVPRIAHTHWARRRKPVHAHPNDRPHRGKVLDVVLRRCIRGAGAWRNLEKPLIVRGHLVVQVDKLQLRGRRQLMLNQILDLGVAGGDHRSRMCEVVPV